MKFNFVKKNQNCGTSPDGVLFRVFKSQDKSRTYINVYADGKLKLKISEGDKFEIGFTDTGDIGLMKSNSCDAYKASFNGDSKTLKIGLSSKLVPSFIDESVWIYEKNVQIQDGIIVIDYANAKDTKWDN